MTHLSTALAFFLLACVVIIYTQLLEFKLVSKNFNILNDLLNESEKANAELYASLKDAQQQLHSVRNQLASEVSLHERLKAYVKEQELVQVQSVYLPQGYADRLMSQCPKEYREHYEGEFLNPLSKGE